LLVVNGDPVRDIGVLRNRSKLDVVMKGGQFVESKLGWASPAILVSLFAGIQLFWQGWEDRPTCTSRNFT
jgi:hypothetical protein